MTNIEKLKNLVVDLFEKKATKYDMDMDSVMDFVDQIDYPALYQNLVRDMEIAFACRAIGLERDLPQYFGKPLFDRPATLLYRDADCICDIHDGLETRHYWELWLLDDMTLAVTTCYAMVHDGSSYCMEYRERKGADWPDDIMEIDLEFLFDDMVLFRESDNEDSPFIYIEP